MRVPLLSGREVLRALERLGFVEVHRRGSHVKMKHPDGRLIVFRTDRDGDENEEIYEASR